MKKSMIAAALLLAAPVALALELPDSAAATELHEVVVEAQLQRTAPAVSTYIPTSRQKNSAQTGPELLGHMAIPQLGMVTGQTVTTASGQAVSLFIDSVPATEQDLSGMCMADVKKVEYYDFPSDPRFLGKEHVINFVMQRYEYGGYVKAYANEFFISNAGQLNLYAKYQRGRMTFDLAVGGYYSANDHLYENTTETFRLPQPEDGMKQFERVTTADAASVRVRHRNLWPTFKALYTSDKITLSNTIGANFNYQPVHSSAGSVRYEPADFPSSDFSSRDDSRDASVTYSGYWNFILPHRSTLTVNPYYSYSHTLRNSLYTEGAGQYLNGAGDHTHRATLSVRFNRNFGGAGEITLLCNGYVNDNRTSYTGTANAADHLTIVRLGPGLMYNYRNDKLSALLGAGCNLERIKYGSTTEHTTQPWVDASLQYSFSSRSSVSVDFHHAVWTPASTYRSEAVIQSNPLFSYTGNPDLTCYRSYDFNTRYVWMPRNGLNFSFFGYGYFVANRFAFDYEATSSGVIRTITQDAGGYSNWFYGANGTVHLLGRKLMVNGQIGHRIVHHGAPYGWTRGCLTWHLQAWYYTGSWNFGLQYQSPLIYDGGIMSGTRTRERSSYVAIAGWGNGTWSVQCRLTNPFRWDWRAATSEMSTAAYDVTRTYFNTSYHCFILLSATCTIGFGKKIKTGGEASQQSGASSGILR
ncbi:MAG: hypothetical protein K2L21_05460 [Muribaculaceae bacterium]|nr:hypothetical protein [Muribaculaceae bacterium]